MAGFHSRDAVIFVTQTPDIGIVDECDAKRFRPSGKRGREFVAVAGFVIGQAQATDDLAGIDARFGFGTAGRIENFERHAPSLQHLDILADIVDLLLFTENFQGALGALVILDTGFGAQLDQAVARIFGDTHHAALVARIADPGAVAQHGEHPAHGGRIDGRAHDQRSMFHEQPLQRLLRDAGRGPRRGITRRHFAGIGETGLQSGAGLAVEDRDLMAGFRQIPGGGDADHTGAENNDLHSVPTYSRWKRRPSAVRIS